MKKVIIKELSVLIIIITLSIIGILKLNDIINYQIKINNINNYIIAKNFDEAEINIKYSGLKFKDKNILKEKIKEGKESQYVK
ncbi:MAG: hypothetical protein MUO60_02110 [Clostridiaceae bacterium]|nr:hypothetical protein [Clostridiaceae bacterium]